ncbi:hypothetical protein KKC17_03855 [Patescibacteria group bacterium]|nr:hypothetical protein [Patescibacteria group bacterium]
MNERQHTLLAEIIRSYIKNAELVSSKALQGNLGISSATIRNEMVDLTDQGYLAQPHTSAGRQPTIKAYRYYLDKIMFPVEPNQDDKKKLEQIFYGRTSLEPETVLRQLAKELASLTNQAAVIGFSGHDVYYTGLSNLFYQPEFSHLDMIRSISSAIDQLDESMAQLYKTMTSDVQIKIGRDNPFGADCAVVCLAYPGKHHPQLVGLLGPLRMDYDYNVGTLQYVKKLFQ